MLELIEFKDGHFEKIYEENGETFFTDATPEEVSLWKRLQSYKTSGPINIPELNKIFFG
jgi:hypothetical protein|tara:strand:- start:21 stop:197 length:177 start_codon:yes stop_codon:yes gene_type:complete